MKPACRILTPVRSRDCDRTRTETLGKPIC